MKRQPHHVFDPDREADINYSKLVSEALRVKENVERWLNMGAQEMRLHAGELTADEIRSVRAVLKAIRG